MAFFLQQPPCHSHPQNPYLVRPVAPRMKRLRRDSLSPEDAATMTGRSQVPSYDNTEIFFQQVKANHGHLPRTSSINSLDSIPTRPVSSTSWISSFTQHTIPSPTSATFSIRSKSSQAALPKGPIFKRLPQEIYDRILEQLRELHSDKLSPSCTTCYMRDLVALQLTSRSWDKGVRKTLYSNIHISDNDSPTQLKKYKMKCGSRLRLLRRTLRERRMLGSLVKDLTVPDPSFSPVLPNGRLNPQYAEYRDLVASVVMVCPNLERLSGFYTFYNHEFDRLTHALSTRRKLKEHVWIVSENQDVVERSQYVQSPGLLDEHQIYQFMHYHYAWTSLETLMFCSPGGTGVIEHELFLRIFQLLPSLKNLCISCFDGADFGDDTLLAVPALTSLRIEECPGISEYGLSQWAKARGGSKLEALTLIHQNINGLLSISKLLTSLPLLKKLTFVQADSNPSIPSDHMVFQPIMASPSLEHLHWDVAPSGHFTSTKYYAGLPPSSQNVQTANSHLASSIIHGGFPQLRTLRAPQDLDPPGILQDVCRPTLNAQILLPADRYGLPPPPRGGGTSMPETLPTNNSLHAARIRAQSYIETAAKSEKDFCKVLITYHTDHEGSGHESSASEYSESTNPTDPGDLFPENEDPIFDTGPDRPLSVNTQTNKEISESILSMLGSPTSPRCPIPPRPAPIVNPPLKLYEFSLPPFMGRVSVSVKNPVRNPPRFDLLPDVPEYDTDGGIIGWADLLKLKEKDDRAVNGPAWMKDGCTGQSNRGLSTKGSDWWKHTERERRGAVTIATKHFF